MELGAEILKPRQGLAEVLVHGSRLQGAQPHPHRRGALTDGRKELPKGRLLGKIPPPGGDLNARDHHLPVACLGDLPGLGDGLLQGQRTHGAAGIGDDAVGAEVAASVLHLEHGAGAFGHAPRREHLEGAAAEGVVHGEGAPLLRDCGLHRVEKGHAPAGAGHHVHVQRLHGLRFHLGVAAAHRHHRRRILPPDAADHVPGLLVRHRRDGAGVDDVGVAGLVPAALNVAALGENLLHSLGLILVYLTAQGIDGKMHHRITKILIEY